MRGGNKNSGRKTKFEEKNIVEGFKRLSPLYFDVVEKLLKSDVKSDKIEGAKLIKGGMEKFIPTVMAGDPDNPLIGVIQYPVKQLIKQNVETTS